MKKFMAIAAFFLLAVMLAAHGNERGKTEVTVDGKKISIDYGRPKLNGREFAVPEGTKWRMGADRATTLDSEAALSFGSAEVPSGAYRLSAERTADGWVLIIGDVARAPMKGATVDESTEMLTITLEAEGSSGTLRVQWGQTELTTDFSAR